MHDLEAAFKRRGFLMSNRQVRECLMDLGYTRRSATNILYRTDCPKAPTHADFVEKWVRERKKRKHPPTLYQRKALYFRERGYTFRQIAEKMGVCLSTAHRSYKKGRQNEFEAPKQGPLDLDGLTQM